MVRILSLLLMIPHDSYFVQVTMVQILTKCHRPALAPFRQWQDQLIQPHHGDAVNESCMLSKMTQSIHLLKASPHLGH